MTCGLGLNRCCRIAALDVVAAGSTTAVFSMRSAGVSALDVRGGICRANIQRGKRFGTGSTVGPAMARGTGSWPNYKVRLTPRPSWSGWCRLIQPSLEPISTLPVPAAPAQGARSNHKDSPPEPDDHALGRSRGGWTTKTHLGVDRQGRPLSVRLTAGQAGDNPQLLPLLADIAVPARDGSRRVRKRPDVVVADKAYSHQPSTLPSTRNATSWNGPSTGSNSGGPSPPATTRRPPTTARRGAARRNRPLLATVIHQTRPRSTTKYQLKIRRQRT